MSGQVLIGVAGYALAVNLLAYAAMVLDKAKAEAGLRRIPEATLLNLAIAGGSIGTIAAQRTICHKTRKEPFRTRLLMIVLIQCLVLVVLIVGLIVTGSPERLWLVLVA